ncbi:MAG TPA: GNAT family N-acetyltransferase [Bacteroidia bacterium]|nr:GNAT family N-acetyltransferase [Bacteroidia bacterium]
MNTPPEYHVVNALCEAQIEQLHALYQREWWSIDRSLEDVRTMLQHSDYIFGIVSKDSQQLCGFARILTDEIFKALVFDVIIHPDHRSRGLGFFLMEHITNHPVISRVQHVELYCLPERVEFYQKQGFSSSLGELTFMRRTRSNIRTGRAEADAGNRAKPDA